MIIAKNGFRDEEYQIPFDYFNSKSITIDVASTEKGDCFGKYGLLATADKSFEEVDIHEYFAVVLVGGPGSKELVGNKRLEKILHSAVRQDIIIGAICYSPVILARAGILKGKKSTVWNGDGLNSGEIEKYGAAYVDQSVVSDGLIITADGPQSAKKYAEEIVKKAECSDCWMKK